MTRSILISGCSSGIGLVSARALRAAGWRVFASCRAEEDCERLRAEGFESPRLDQAESTSIRACFDRVLDATGGTLDAVYANGAFAQPGALADVPRDAMRAIFETNVFGVHEMARLALPVMRAQGHGRIVICSSVLGIGGMRYRGPYVGTKFALEGMCDSLRLELRDAPWAKEIHVSLLQPGPIPTMIRTKSRPHFERWIDWQGSAWRGMYESTLMPRLAEPEDAEARHWTAEPPEAVAKALMRALTDASPRARYRITRGTTVVELARRFLPPRLYDEVLRMG